MAVVFLSFLRLREKKSQEGGKFITIRDIQRPEPPSRPKPAPSGWGARPNPQIPTEGPQSEIPADVERGFAGRCFGVARAGTGDGGVGGRGGEGGGGSSGRTWPGSSWGSGL